MGSNCLSLRGGRRPERGSQRGGDEGEVSGPACLVCGLVWWASGKIRRWLRGSPGLPQESLDCGVALLPELLQARQPCQAGGC